MKEKQRHSRQLPTSRKEHTITQASAQGDSPVSQYFPQTKSVYLKRAFPLSPWKIWRLGQLLNNTPAPYQSVHNGSTRTKCHERITNNRLEQQKSAVFSAQYRPGCGHQCVTDVSATYSFFSFPIFSTYHFKKKKPKLSMKFPTAYGYLDNQVMSCD